MKKEIIERLEKLLGRELEAGEKERLQRIKDTLQIADNDALWDILVAMEYQRTYYEELPEKIREATMAIFAELSQTAKTPPGSNSPGVIREQVRRLPLKTYTSSLLVWGGSAVILLLLYGSLLLWVGMSIDSKSQFPPLLHMPVGVIIGALCLFNGVVCGFLAAWNCSEGSATWPKHLLIALSCLLPGAWVFSVVLP